MRKGLWLCALLLSTQLLADVPEVVLTYKNSTGEYGTFAGKLSVAPAEPMGITVDNAGLKFSTVTDKEGNWAISFRQIAVMSDITAWSLANPKEPSHALRVNSH